MKPATPIIPGHDLPVTNFAETQHDYETLPAFRQDDNKPLQPISLQVERPEVS